jgi:hypothetical protein
MANYGISPVSFESVSAVTTVPSVELGTRRHDSGVDYVYAYNTGAATIGQGKLGFLPAATMSSQFSVTVSNAASQSGGEFAVGVAHNAAIAASSYGWLATKGLVYISVDGSEVSMNSGVRLAAGVDGGFVAAPATLSTGTLLGVTINSIVTTVGTGKAWFRSPMFG